jgi:hypothetical protein
MEARMTTACDICDLLAARADSGRVAFRISETVSTKVIGVVRQHFDLSYQEAELLLIDVMREHEKQLYAVLHNRVPLDEALDAVYLCLEDHR